VNGTLTPVAPAQNGPPVIVTVVIIFFCSAKRKNRLEPIKLEIVTPEVPAVPAKFVYVPVTVVLVATASNGAIAVGLEMETELLVKLPAVTRDQYSVVLFETSVASTLPLEFRINA